MVLPGAAKHPVTIYHLEEVPISGSHMSYCMRGYNWRERFEEGLRTRLPFSQQAATVANGGAESKCDKHTHTVRINTVMLVDISSLSIFYLPNTEEN